MNTQADNVPVKGDETKMRHYWLREDFDELIGVIPGADMAMAGDRDASCSLVYPKSTQGAAAELKLRGLKCDGHDLQFLVDKGIINPGRGQALMTDDKGNTGFGPSDSILYWNKEHIDAAAEWFYENGDWNSWTHFCWVANLQYGQAVKAHRVACARYGRGFSLSFDIPGWKVIIDPAKDATRNYARIRFLPADAVVDSQDQPK